MQSCITIHGGGLAGSAAAIAACQMGAHEVRVYERSQFPRHKVCGEFLTAAAEKVLRELHVWTAFRALQPASITKLGLHFPGKSSYFPLPEACWGISRHALDECLMVQAVAAGAEWLNQPAPTSTNTDEAPIVLAHGRQQTGEKGKRIFGFKAHHEGPPSDAVELYFFDGCYVGVAPIENGRLNVCGLGPEAVMRQHAFDYDSLCVRSPALQARLAGMRRSMDWLSVGPLVYHHRFRDHTDAHVYPAGDALGFVDPFTGTGMFNALLSGSLAGQCAVAAEPVAQYLQQAASHLYRPFFISGFFRAAMRSGIGAHVAGYLPGSLLFRATRAQLG